jgi:hypothetical protein
MPDPSVTTGQHAAKFAPKQDKAAPKNVAGQWMFLQEASEALSLHEKTLRRNIKRGTLKARQGKAVNAKIQVFITQDFLNTESKDSGHEDTEEDTILDDVQIEEYIVEDVTGEQADAGKSIEAEQDFSPEPSAHVLSTNMDAVKGLVNELMTPLVKRIEEQTIALNEQTKTIRDQETVITDQKIQLRLLPDLKAREEAERQARELAVHETEALKKQIEALDQSQKSLKAAADKAALLEKELEIAKRPLWKKLFLPRDVNS